MMAGGIFSGRQVRFACVRAVGWRPPQAQQFFPGVGRSLLVCGEVDRMTPVKAVAPLLEALQATGDAHLVVLPGCGHGMLEENPAAVVQALLAG